DGTAGALELVVEDEVGVRAALVVGAGHERGGVEVERGAVGGADVPAETQADLGHVGSGLLEREVFTLLERDCHVHFLLCCFGAWWKERPACPHAGLASPENGTCRQMRFESSRSGSSKAQQHPHLLKGTGVFKAEIACRSGAGSKPILEETNVCPHPRKVERS